MMSSWDGKRTHATNGRAEADMDTLRNIAGRDAAIVNLHLARDCGRVAGVQPLGIAGRSPHAFPSYIGG